MSTYKFDGYIHATTTGTAEICELIYHPDGDINQWLDDQGATRVDTTDGICVGVGIGAAILSSPTTILGSAASGIMAGTLCGAGREGCKVEDFATALSGCGDLKLEVHVAENPIINAVGDPGPIPPNILVAPKCSSGLGVYDIIDAIRSAGGTVVEEGQDLVGDGIETGKDAVDDGVDAGKDLVDDGVDAGKDLVDDGVDAGKDLVDDGVDAGEDIIDQGSSLFGL